MSKFIQGLSYFVTGCYPEDDEKALSSRVGIAPSDTLGRSILDEKLSKRRSASSLNSGGRGGKEVSTCGLFSSPCCAVISGACDGANAQSSGRAESEAMQKALKAFTKSMQEGLEVFVVLDDGTMLSVTLALDQDVTALTLQSAQAHKHIQLAEVRKVLAPEEVQLHLATVTNAAHLNERCTTLLLGTSQFLSFAFGTERLREYFEACLKALLVSRRPTADAAGNRPTLPLPASPLEQSDQVAEMAMMTPTAVSRQKRAAAEETSELGGRTGI
eukprot:TRINITY_DN21287_c0_g1_i2.p1 TRINITY_DN21287_c0_g1~~TRINITY_DN21287_c0_g1_i2.p1  ORF type:complete len:273 (+),score=44.80 TRINITY_DN21287_c0_g1_i2:105-923(+)